MPRKKIALTGGPSGGKTTLIETLQRELGHQIAVVPEAASILYKGGFPRRRNTNRQKHAQKAIYFTQFELEALVEEENPEKLIICDRGSLDSLAYWPENYQSFLHTMKTTIEHEVKRYDWVLHLDTAPRNHYDSENPIRLETFEEAVELNEKIKKAWAYHPNLISVGSNQDFLSKITACISVVNGILNEQSFVELKKRIEGT